MYISKFLLTIFAGFEFAYLSYHIFSLIRDLAYYAKHKEKLYTSKQKEIFLLNERIAKLEKEKSYLELQLQEITETMIKNLQEKS